MAFENEQSKIRIMNIKKRRKAAYNFLKETKAKINQPMFLLDISEIPVDTVEFNKERFLELMNQQPAYFK